MRNDTKPPTIAHDVKALAQLYRTLLSMWARRLTKRDRWEHLYLYEPIEIIRPRGGAYRNGRY